jgi:hypothetical protein
MLIFPKGHPAQFIDSKLGCYNTATLAKAKADCEAASDCKGFFRYNSFPSAASRRTCFKNTWIEGTSQAADGEFHAYPPLPPPPSPADVWTRVFPNGHPREYTDSKLGCYNTPTLEKAKADCTAASDCKAFFRYNSYPSAASRRTCFKNTWKQVLKVADGEFHAYGPLPPPPKWSRLVSNGHPAQYIDSSLGCYNTPTLEKAEADCEAAPDCKGFFRYFSIPSAASRRTCFKKSWQTSHKKAEGDFYEFLS